MSKQALLTDASASTPTASAAAASAPAEGDPAPSTPAAAEPVRLGRPRDPRLDTAIVDATLALLVEGGYGSLTMEAVASRAGVGKASLYRRFPSKEQLVVEAVASLAEPLEPVEGAGVRDGLVHMLELVRRKSTDSLAGQIFPRLLSASADHPELMRLYRQRVIDPRRERLVEVLRRGVAERLVRPDVDLDHAVDLLLGPMVYRNLVRTDPPPEPDLSARIVDDVLTALAPRTAAARRTDPAPPTHRRENA